MRNFWTHNPTCVYEFLLIIKDMQKDMGVHYSFPPQGGDTESPADVRKREEETGNNSGKIHVVY